MTNRILRRSRGRRDRSSAASSTASFSTRDGGLASGLPTWLVIGEPGSIGCPLIVGLFCAIGPDVTGTPPPSDARRSFNRFTELLSVSLIVVKSCTFATVLV